MFSKTCLFLRTENKWEFVSGNQFWFDLTGQLVCPSDPCSVSRCGPQATCTPMMDSERTNGTNIMCTCKEGFTGNPYERQEVCFIRGFLSSHVRLQCVSDL